MAKGNGKTLVTGNGQEKPQPAYFKSLTIEDVKCFKGKHTIDLTDGNGKPAQWTVILGNNNTGKTTILKCLAGLEPKEIKFIVGGQDATYTEIEAGAKPSFKIPQAAPTFLFSELGDDFLSPSKSNHEFSIHSKLLINSQVGNSLSVGEFYRYNDGGKENYGFQFDKQINQSEFLFGSPQILLNSLVVYSYGASRRMSNRPIADERQNRPHSSLFENRFIVNIEDWLLNLFLAEKLGQPEARTVLEIAKNLLSSDLLPDVKEVNLSSREEGVGFVNFVEFRTDFGWIRLRDLGYGYQTMIAWVLDLVKRMIERYPKSPNPLAEPAIVLVDEIDLHLHPDWQRKIIAHLTKYFPNTQFIATAHSPLVVQSAEEVNIVILKKEGESVHIEQPKIRSFRGWTVEEILTDLMDLAGQTMSQEYLGLMDQFNDALQDDDIEKAEAAYRGLDKILHPDSSGRTLLKLQMSSLSPAFAL